MSEYDCIVVGAGAGGGVVAGVLAEASKRVLLLERGPSLTYDQVGIDHLRNQRLSRHGVNAGPDLEGNPRVSVRIDGTVEIVGPLDGGYENNAACVGGGTRVYGAQAWRFMPQDFRMASTYGVPDGSSLADWPITYEDLEPYYDRAEWEIGVCGDASRHAGQGARRRGFPMPPIGNTRPEAILARGAEKLGWQTQPAPLAINSVARDGRPACAKCTYCVGFACPVDAKNGTQNTTIPRALATGYCKLVTGAIVERIDTDSSGNVIGVTYLVDDRPSKPDAHPHPLPKGRGDDPTPLPFREGPGVGSVRRVTARAKCVVVSGGAIESARLLLNSASPMHPRGLGNAHDQVGRHLDSHCYIHADGLMPEPVFDGIGPGVAISTTRFTHGNPGIVGGGMLANDFIKLPIMFWREQMPPWIPLWGLENKRHMRDYYTRTLRVAGPINNIPTADARVQVDPSVRDKYGIPVPRMSGHTHPETVRSMHYMQDRAAEWLEACGAERIWRSKIQLQRGGGQHQAGTCRMGNDPKTSVTDAWGRVHDHDNLYVVDGSLHTSMGGFNPVLTIFALAFRSAEHIASTI